MILPNDEECRRVCIELEDDPGLTEWELQFVNSNVDRLHFKDRQREIIAELMEKFEI